MKLESFVMRMDAQEARSKALKQAGPLGKMVVGKNPDIHMQTIYIENIIITYQFTNKPLPLVRLLRKNKDLPQQARRIRVIANGSTSGVSYYDGDGAEIMEMDVNEDQVQYSDYPEEKLVMRGNVLARRILRRRIGGNLTIEPLEIKRVFRPYHVAFFGEPIEGKKVRYLPIPADGCTIKRTF